MEFKNDSEKEIKSMSKNKNLITLSQQWINSAQANKYSYHFEWMGRPIIQYPQDILAMQELIWQIQPDLIIETGIAHGGSLIFYASMLELNALCGGPQNAHILGIDIDIRPHNKKALKTHPMSKRVTLKQGSSIDKQIIEEVRDFAKPYKNILVALDSNHTHEHVLAELNAYAGLVSLKSYCIVFDTIIEHLSQESIGERPWGKGNNPMTSVNEFLKTHPEFEIDEMIDAKLMISVAPKGYLKRIKE